ncbi:MAG: CpsD/CapB family tyrosine-protein kinase [Planctomycetes bacterium]|nr:CpsD/CapB family tyrosine-protein kinase [Planctomycetota bacterium]
MSGHAWFRDSINGRPPNGGPVARIDAPHAAPASTRPTERARATAAALAPRGEGAGPQTPFLHPANVPHHAAEDGGAPECLASRVDRWLSADSVRRPGPFAPDRPTAIPSAFERATADQLARDPLRRSELERIGDLCWSDGAPAMRRVLLISFADPIDVPRILIGACPVSHHRPMTVLVDADSKWKTLSTLAQLDVGPGLGDLLGGRAELDDVIVALASNALLIPAGTVLASDRCSTVSPLSQWRPSGMMLIDGGAWPVLDLARLASFADRVFAVVRVERTRWGDLHQLRRALASLGRRLDGCIASGGFE